MRMRKKKHGDERISTLQDLFIDESEVEKVSSELFIDKDKSLRLEIGCGKGGFIRQISQKENNFNYIAIEKMSDVAIVAAEGYAGDNGLGKLAPNGGWLFSDGTIYKDGEPLRLDLSKRGNVRFIIGDANKLCDMLPKHSFESIYVNFCDPWEKKGYANRRLTSPVFLNKYKELLIDGGYLKFKTDNVKLFDYSEETIPENGFDVIFKTRDLHNSEYNEQNIRTEYENNFSSKGFTINFILAKKK